MTLSSCGNGTGGHVGSAAKVGVETAGFHQMHQVGQSQEPLALEVAKSEWDLTEGIDELLDAAANVPTGFVCGDVAGEFFAIDAVAA